jgi:hypothetical protein
MSRKRSAVVEGGVLWKEFNREAQLHGPGDDRGVIGTTGVAGLTLGGGLGWLMPKYGMALDNLVAVNLVLADGAIVRASAADHRTSSGRCAAAAGISAWRRRSNSAPPGWTDRDRRSRRVSFREARKVLAAYRELAATAPDELMMVCALTTAPDGSGTKIVGVAACHCGSKGWSGGRGQIKTFGTVAVDAMGPIPYAALNGMLDGGFAAGVQLLEVGLLPRLDDAALDSAGSGIRTVSGADQRAPRRELPRRRLPRSRDATAYALRDPVSMRSSPGSGWSGRKKPPR